MRSSRPGPCKWTNGDRRVIHIYFLDSSEPDFLRMSCFVSVDLSGAKEDQISDENRLQFVPVKIRYGQKCNFFQITTIL